MTSSYLSYGGKAKVIIENNNYMVLASCAAEGQSWASPVFFTHDGKYDLYFLSAVDSQHCKNIAKNGKVGIAIFDSTQGLGSSDGVQIIGTVSPVDMKDLKKVIELYVAKLFPSSDVPPTERYNPEDYDEASEMRFYKVELKKVYITGPDRRVEIDLTEDKEE